MYFSGTLMLIKNNMSIYCKLVETFHVSSEWKTAVYFKWWYTERFVYETAVPTVRSLVLLNFMTGSDLQLCIETEEDQTRLTLQNIQGSQY